MASMDAETAAAVAALVVALVAMFIAIAQAVQQYFITGQLIRLCDSVVFGPLPGQGRRIWQLSQFRFRVVYSIPQISLDSNLWPDQPPHTRSYAIGRHELPPVEKIEGSAITSIEEDHRWLPRFRHRKPQRQPQKVTSSQRVGEASWVSWCRAIQAPCGDSVRFDFVEYDADRCPPDLVTAPMQVSMRDIVIMGLMSGMEVTSCSFHEKSISMQGDIGTITSSNHPVLGPLLHFAPRYNENMYSSYGTLPVSPTKYRGEVTGRWLSRTWNLCKVAGRYLNSTARRTVRRLDDRWLGQQTQREVFLADEGKRWQRAKRQRQREADAQAKDDGERADRSKRRDFEPLRPYPQDGDWVLEMPPEPRKERSPNLQDERDSHRTERQCGKQKVKAEIPKISKPKDTTPETSPPGAPSRQPTVDDVADDGSENRPDHRSQRPDVLTIEEKPPSLDFDTKERMRIAKERQAERTAKIETIEKDKALVEESVKRGAMASPYDLDRLLLTEKPHYDPKEKEVDQSPSEEKGPRPTPDEDEAREREEERQRVRQQRDDERDERHKSHVRSAYLVNVDAYWLCQMDIFDGFWATPWVEFCMTDAALTGAVTAILEAFLGFLDENSLVYHDDRELSVFSFQETARWMFRGNYTYPAYAHNARGGVIAAGTYHGVRIPAFQSVIPALELLYSYEWQVDMNLRNPARYCTQQNVELMRLDSWLSYVGRTHEITHGRSKLLTQMPSLILLMIHDFELDFQHLDLSAREGGLQDIQGVAADLMDFLADEELSDAEQLYALVALLRTIKVCQCVMMGSDTTSLRDILLKDIQVHMV
ncbi:hypothetical protein AJ80_04124 [Polytolypa hystricis UAMH7299]|uniref:Uncharacterized protein n=1 Tax=Polytolypa hystricis (strain UAMH7299) TaxID=1447883 RepID=A0A2B7YDV1_POLH7|nr:hypothetical protein AJ80_04124 [Polytolypa hystricis UAMH7299]